MDESKGHGLAVQALATVLTLTLTGCGGAKEVSETQPSVLSNPTQTAVTLTSEQAMTPSDIGGGSQINVPLLAVDLDTEIQWAIFDVCERDPDTFCFLMAIAEHESGFDSETVGDGGRSIGMMQINTRWHAGRMEALGVTDLTDPVQCAAVAIDYLRELVDRYGFEPGSEALLMAYNMGPDGARKALNGGTSSTKYSREVMTTYQNYKEEMEWTTVED